MTPVARLEKSRVQHRIFVALAHERRRAVLRRFCGWSFLVSMMSALLTLWYMSTPDTPKQKRGVVSSPRIALPNKRADIAPYLSINPSAGPLRRPMALRYHDSPTTSAKVHRKWQAVLERHATVTAVKIDGGPSTLGEFWTRTVSQLQDVNPLLVLENVNRHFNQYGHKKDFELWGMADYWATPLEMMIAGFGDCEDNAIAKYLALRSLGFAEDSLRLLVVLDESRNGDVHAVVAVKLQEQILILDQLTDEIKTYEDSMQYNPIYAISESSIWLYSMERLQQAALSSKKHARTMFASLQKTIGPQYVR